MKHQNFTSLHLVVPALAALLAACSGRDLQLGQDMAEVALRDGENGMGTPGEGTGGASSGEEMTMEAGGYAPDGESGPGGRASSDGTGTGAFSMGGHASDDESGTGGFSMGGHASDGTATGGFAMGGASSEDGTPVMTMQGTGDLMVMQPSFGQGGAAGIEFAPTGERPASSMDPYGSCEVVSDAANDHFPFKCSADGIDCTGWGGPCSPEHCENYFVACDHLCMTNDDCPVPLTGDATPVCVDSVHACELPCDEDTTCPDGFECVSTENWGLSNPVGSPVPLPNICMQVYTATPL